MILPGKAKTAIDDAVATVKQAAAKTSGFVMAAFGIAVMSGGPRLQLARSVAEKRRRAASALTMVVGGSRPPLVFGGRADSAYG